MKLFNSLCKVINMNVNKWKRKERKGIERKEKENHKKKIL
jgi:hypothetical protein